MIIREKELRNVPGLNPDDVVVIKRFTYGEKNKIVGSCVDMKLGSKGFEGGNLDVEKYRLYTLVYGIKSAPFFKFDLAENLEKQKIDAINNLDPETGDYLFNEITELNSPLEGGEKK